MNYYNATIPAHLAASITTKPWEVEQSIEPARPATVSGSSAPKIQRPATVAERPAISDSTGGNQRHDTRQRLPTNSRDLTLDNNSGSERALSSTDLNDSKSTNKRTLKDRALTFQAVGHTAEQIAKRLEIDVESVKQLIN